jgi:hypothetical protein
MSSSLTTSILIKAAPEKVWEVLTDFESYPSWNPFIRSLTGDVATGKKIRVTLHPPGGSAMTFKPKVLAFDPSHEFCWLGHLWIKGLFDGEHRFVLQDNGDGTTLFLHSEHFGGILLPLFQKMLETKTKAGFEQMNEALKKRVEELK